MLLLTGPPTAKTTSVTILIKDGPLGNLRRFQKCLRRATAASTPSESEAAEALARRLMETYKIDPVKVPDKSVYDYTDFSDNTLLLKLRQEHIAEQQKQLLKKSKHKHKRGNKPKGPRQKVELSDYEVIRVLYNEGLGPKEIGKRLGYNDRSVNSVRHRHFIRDKNWVLDADGKLQWAKKEEKVT